MAYTLPDLPYDYDALEPHFDARTMEIHHTKHHNAYIAKVNAAIEGSQWDTLSAETLIADLSKVPEGFAERFATMEGVMPTTAFSGLSSAQTGGGTRAVFCSRGDRI